MKPLRSLCLSLFLGALAALQPFQASAQTATAPTITTQPTSLSVATGAAATFTVVAAGTTPLTYQWAKGGAAIGTATSATLTLPAVTATDAGSYTVTVTNAAGSVTSTAATLTVTPLSTAPVITLQPASQTVAAGASVTFSVTATGTGTLAYSWFKDGRLLSLGSASTLTIAAATAADAGVYRVTVTSAGGSTVSDGATLTVTGTPPPTTGTAPTITTQPASLVVTAGANATFTVVADGTAPLHYQWMKNGRRIEDTDSATFAITSAKVEDAAVYTVKVSNGAGSVTSAPATLAINVVAGTITTAPANATAKAGTDVKFTVTAAGTGLTYQWKFNGRTIKNATDASLALTNVGVLAAGAYSVTVSTSAGPAAAAAAALTVTTDAHLSNIATRGHVGEDDEVLISGFVTRGPGQKKILLRAVGPTLGTAFSVTDSLANPKLTLYSAGKGNAVVDTNSGWGGATALATAFTQVGAFPLPPASADAALLETLDSGAYSAVVTAPSGKSGVALVEAYDADTGSPPAEIINISTRALVGAEAANTLIAGFVVSGTTSDTVLIRGVGPSLGTLFGLRRALGASHVAVFDSKGNQIAANTVWGKAGRGEDNDAEDEDKENDMDNASDRSGAWHLPRGSTDSALLLTLAPGVYTAHVTGVNGRSGIGLVEIFEVR